MQSYVLLYAVGRGSPAFQYTESSSGGWQVVSTCSMWISIAQAAFLVMVFEVGGFGGPRKRDANVCYTYAKVCK